MKKYRILTNLIRSCKFYFKRTILEFTCSRSSSHVMQYISFYVWPCKAVTFIPFIFIVSKINVIVSGCHPIVFYISQTSNITNKRRRICYNLCSIYNFSRFVSSPQLLICLFLHIHIITVPYICHNKNQHTL